MRATVDEALAIERNKLAGSWYVFGNLRDQRDTKGGWKATLAKPMDACESEAKSRGLPFERFSPQDCRPKGVSEKPAKRTKTSGVRFASRADKHIPNFEICAGKTG